jgi:hypothetical protein
MKNLFYYLFLISISTRAQTMKIEQEKWNKENLFCNSGVLSFRTKISGKLKYMQYHVKTAMNPLNHKTIGFDYYPLDFHHFRVNLSTEFDYSDYVVNWPGYTWASGPLPKYDCEVRHLFAGAGLYYDFNYTLIKMNRKVHGKKIRVRIQPGITYMQVVSSSTTYFYQGEMKLRLEKEQYYKNINFFFRDEIKVIVVPREPLSLGISIANLLTKIYNYFPLQGPVDLPTSFFTMGINFNYNFQ